MAKHTRRKLTIAEVERSRRARASFEADRDRLITVGQGIRESRERIEHTLRALKAERERQGLTLTELARRTGISKAALSRLENAPHPNPTINTLMRIAEALDMRLDVVLAPPTAA